MNLNVTWRLEQTYLLGTGDLERFLVIGSAFNLSSCGFRDLFWDVFVVGEGEATLTVADEVTVIGSARWDNRGELGADADWGFKTSWILGLWATGNCASCSCFFAPVLVLRWGWKYEISKWNMIEIRARGTWILIIENHRSLGQMKYLYRCRGLRRKIHWSFFVRAFGWCDSSFLLLIRRRPECMLILWRGGCFEFFFVILVSIWKVFWTLNCCICIGITIKLTKCP